jgi:hypothetical protein
LAGEEEDSPFSGPREPHGRQDFLLQIYHAIDQVEFLVLLMTPKALASDAVKKEWRYARQRWR